MAIETALAIGVDRIEFDVQVSGDGQLMLVHDDVLRLPDGRRVPIKRTSAQTIRDTLPGMLSMDEAIELIGNRSKLLIDVKSPGYDRQVADAIRRHALGSSAIVSSTWAAVLRQLKRALPELSIGLSTGHMAGGIAFEPARVVVASSLRTLIPMPLLSAARAIGATDVMLHHRVVDARTVRTMHSCGIRVNAWTVDHPKRIRAMLDLGVDAVISNRPDLVMEEIDRLYASV